VIPEAPYLFSVAALSVTLAGFAGLVAAFRRGSELMPIDIYRLRQIAEFGLGNALIALATIPLSTTTGDLTLALRVCGAIGVLFIFGGVALLLRRQRRLGVRGQAGLNPVIVVIDLAAIVAGLATVVVGSVGIFEWELLFLLSRPMLAFTFVLASLRHA
jgi:hypothetical protein